MKSDCKTRIIIDTNLWISFLIGKNWLVFWISCLMKRLNLLFQIITVMEFDVLASSSGYSFFVHEDFEDYYHLVVRE